MKQELEDLSHFADFHDAYLARNIQLADSKAGVLATAAASAMALLLSQDPFRTALSAAAFSTDWYLSRATVVTLSLAFILAFFVIAPRRARSAVDFEQVSQFPDAGAFFVDLKRLRPEGIIESRIANCYETAKVCTQKYAFLRSSLAFAALGALLTIVAFIKVTA